MVKYVLESKVADNGTKKERVVSKSFENEDEAIEVYNLALKRFTKGLRNIREIFDLDNDDYSFYFMGIPKLYKQKISREQYKP